MIDIKNVADFLAKNEQPIFYLNRPSLHLLGVEKYVANFYSIRLLDPWQVGAFEPWVFSPKQKPETALSHSETVSWLLNSAEVQNFIAAKTPAGVKPKIVAYLHDKKSEELCERLGYDLLAIPVALRTKFDGKIFTTELSERAGLTNVPNMIGEFSNYAGLIRLSEDTGLGTDLVLQTDHGEAGLGTYFISSETDFQKYESEIINKKIKIMKRINHRSLAIDAAILPDGVIVGPLLQDIIGPKEVAINPGSSSGLEYYPSVLPAAAQKTAYEMVIKYGEQLKKEGYLGVFEVDVLHDTDTDELFFGEANPRFSGCAMVTNAVTIAHWGLPLYALQVYAFLAPESGIQVSSFNDSWNSNSEDPGWANLLLRHIDDDVEKIVSTPKSGIYKIATNGELIFQEEGSDWFDLKSPAEVFFLSYRKAGDLKVYGDDIGTLFMRKRFQNDAGVLTAEAKSLVKAVTNMYETRKVSFLERAKNSLLRRLKIFRA